MKHIRVDVNDTAMVQLKFFAKDRFAMRDRILITIVDCVYGFIYYL